ncbi:chemotaxis protein CheB [Iodobacter arcticus]|uniref:protein-glutamate O-methyltransferase n=1 Tax=Iodobacter arcticus TaxID=590593 RepID=A0ABW2QXS5_9NEIS
MTAGKVTKKAKTQVLEHPPSLVVPLDTPPTVSFPIIGIGASAGGLGAFEEFFSGMPADLDMGMAFVLVQHLAPDHKSILSDLVQRYTHMQVFEVEDGMVVQPNCAYIIPPNHDMAFLNGALHLLAPSEPRGHRLPIDFFFSSLAQDQHELAIGIVLSGSGSDGTLGIRQIKDEGGMVMAQIPATTEFDGMPSSAIATGLVDYQLKPADMPAKLIAYAAQEFGKLISTIVVPIVKDENSLNKIFILLRTQTGHDFSQYKPSTILRRIERRMVVHQLDSTEQYVKYLQKMPDEIEALFCDILIGVTHFFRDTEAFLALEEQVIPQLFKGKPAGATIRVWSTGCSTGEEAYSIAILLQEQQELLKQNYTIQVFSTDMDRRAIATARAGLYPASIAGDISPQRLARFFTAEADGSAYRIHKGIRDMLVFSEQDVIKDPPFSKLDLISCRNLMIYMGAELQKKLIPMFHYALNPSRFLFLGTSETVGEFADLFAVLDAKSKLYQRKQDVFGIKRAFQPPIAIATTGIALPQAASKQSHPVKRSMREVTEQTLLQQLAPAAALVNEHGDILYLHGRTGMYLELPEGETGINNILKMAREGLRRELIATLHKSVSKNKTIQRLNLSVKTNGHFTPVNLTVRPVVMGQPAGEVLYLVILEETSQLVTPALPIYLPLLERGEHSNFDARIAALNEELCAKDEYLQVSNEKLETINEELKSSNEEMQSVNEELQSTNEELETSKEEMQSINEELTTVNMELQTKVADLSRASNDLNNLLASTGIGTIFVDHQLNILRFTPAATKIINLILSDVGRPVAHTVTNLLGYGQLVADVQDVLNSLIPKEIDVQTQAGKWYTMRIQPYRTLDNLIEGAVITFVDITEMVHAREALRKANELFRLAVVVRDAHDAITVQDLNGRILAWNPGAERMYGWSEAEALQMNAADRIPQALRKEALVQVNQLSQSKVLEPYHTQRLSKSGDILGVSMTSTALVNVAGAMYAIATTERARKLNTDTHHEG